MSWRLPVTDFGVDRNPVAKKNHVCEWCRTFVLIGERYYRYRGKWEGEFQDWAMHLDCVEAHQKETDDGEICDENHPRGRTCDERDEAYGKLEDEVNELIEDELRRLKASEDIVSLVRKNGFGSAIVKDLFKEYLYQEGRRVDEAQKKAMKSVKKEPAGG